MKKPSKEYTNARDSLHAKYVDARKKYKRYNEMSKPGVIETTIPLCLVGLIIDNEPHNIGIPAIGALTVIHGAISLYGCYQKRKAGNEIKRIIKEKDSLDARFN